VALLANGTSLSRLGIKGVNFFLIEGSLCFIFRIKTNVECAHSTVLLSVD